MRSASIFRLGFFIIRSVYHDGADTAPIKPLVPDPRSTSRQLLSVLSGGGDFVRNQYLYRFRLPDVTAGNPERVYVLGARGREFVGNELGLPVDRGFRHDEGKHLSFSQVRHNLALTRLLVAAHRWVSGVGDFKISEMRICYDLAGVAEKVEVEERGKRESIPVVPDAWLHFERGQENASAGRFPLLLEVDRGTMYRQRFKRHVASRIEFVRSGGYKRLFGTGGIDCVCGNRRDRGVGGGAKTSAYELDNGGSERAEEVEMGKDVSFWQRSFWTDLYQASFCREALVQAGSGGAGETV